MSLSPLGCLSLCLSNRLAHNHSRATAKVRLTARDMNIRTPAHSYTHTKAHSHSYTDTHLLSHTPSHQCSSIRSLRLCFSLFYFFSPKFPRCDRCPAGWPINGNTYLEAHKFRTLEPHWWGTCAYICIQWAPWHHVAFYQLLKNDLLLVCFVCAKCIYVVCWSYCFFSLFSYFVPVLCCGMIKITLYVSSR